MALDNEWWGYSPRHGWVVLDRTNPRNKVGGSRYDRLVFVRCRDWAEFTEPRANWTPPAYEYAPVYLKTLKGDSAKAANEHYEDLRSEWPDRKAQLLQAKKDQEQREREEAKQRRRKQLEELNRARRNEQDSIKTFVRDREIVSLIHFTRIENLPSILEHGLLARNIAVRRGLSIVVNDIQRFDGHLEAINVSISFPNYKMFFRKQQDDLEKAWVVLCIRPDVLWELDCSFHSCNAADSNSRTTSHGGGVNSLAEMFAEEAVNSRGEKVTRGILGIPRSFTTDPQAEVLVRGHIDTRYIFGICFSHRSFKDTWESEIARRQSSIKIYEYYQYFRPRSDYKYWPSKGYSDL